MPWWVSLLGLPLLAVALRDIFHTLWHPTGRGAVSAAVMALVWRALGRHRQRQTATLAGPLGMLAVVFTWAGLIILGWALIYWPHLPTGFSYIPHPRTGRADLLDAVYLSLMTLGTLGFGDIVPTEGWLRLITPVEGLIGFGLLTAAVAWVLQIYPALARRRSLALRLALLRDTGAAETVPELDSTTAAQLLQDLASGLVAARVDLTQYPETYYFREPDPDTSLAVVLDYVDRLAEAAQRSRRPDVRFAAANLTAALDDFMQVVDEQFLHLGVGRPAAAEAYLREHGHAALEE